MPDVPDFTFASWQAQPSDAQLQASILKGKGDDMPAFAEKIKEAQARDLVIHVRAFAQTKKNLKEEKKQDPGSSDFEERFARLQKEMDELRRRSRELSQSARTATAKLFQKHCSKCHSADGSGSRARDRLPEIPDFTDSAWQARRTDQQIQSSILHGKGKEMPPTRGKLNEKQAGDLASYIRRFAANEAPTATEKSPP